MTGKNVLKLLDEHEALLKDTAAALKATNVKDLPARAEAVMAEHKAIGRELDALKGQLAASRADELFQHAQEVDGVRIISAYFTGTAPETLRGLCDNIRDKAPDAVAVLVGSANEKISMAVSVSKDAQARGLKAGVLVKQIAAIAGGNGGGKPDFAMAGLKDATKIDEALAAVPQIVKTMLG